MTIHLLGFPTTLGLPRNAVRHAPEALRSGLLAYLRQLDSQVIDHGDMALPPGLQSDPVPVRIAKVVEAARRQQAHWQRVARPGDLLLTIGGDHSTSLGTIMALAAMGHDFDVVWVDAHGDFNTIATSPSGNPHGMVLSLAAGLLPEALPRIIRPEQLRLLGIRAPWIPASGGCSPRRGSRCSPRRGPRAACGTPRRPEAQPVPLV